MDGEPTAQLIGPLPHACHPHAGTVVRRQAVPIVGDVDLEDAVEMDSQRARGCAGVPDDVGERFASDAVGSDLHGGGKPAEPFFRTVNRHRERR